MRIVQVVGARPQFIKLAPVSRALARLGGPEIKERIVHTGQHYDPRLSQVFFDELHIPQPAANLEVGSDTQARQTAGMLERLEEYLLSERPDAVIVYGDTNSTLAGALSASKLHILVAHIEAGLRSFNRAMPEELNRVATDHLSDLLLAPTECALQNLAREGLSARSHLVGDVMYDALIENVMTARERSTIIERLGVESRAFGLATVHRAESTVPAALARVLELLAKVASSCVPLIFPVHPRTREVMRQSLPHWRAPSELRLIEPLGPLDMLRLTERAAVVLTDSGGLQKEAFMLGRPCVTLRRETEWVETISAGANTLVGHDLAAAVSAVEGALNDTDKVSDLGRRAREAYGQGHAAERCVERILHLAHPS